MKYKSLTGNGVLVLLPMIPGLLLHSVALADSMRCGQKVVRTGDSQAMLMEKCGEPLHRSRAHARVKTQSGVKEVRVEQWHYKKSDRSLERIVLVYRGEIVRVETRGR